MKWLLYLTALAVTVFGVSLNRTDVARLHPVELVRVIQEEDTIIIETDTGETGTGKTVDDAMRNLKETVVGVIFLDTADYLVLGKGSEDLLPDLARWLRPDCLICSESGPSDPAEAAPYLKSHTPELSLEEYLEEETGIPLLEINGDRMYLREK